MQAERSSSVTPQSFMADALRSSPPLRLFLALWPDEAVRDRIWSWQQAWRWPPGARLVARERLHLTLHFIGNVAAARLPELVLGSRVDFEALDMAFGDAAVWPGGIAVLRPHATPPALARLHARLAASLTALELPVEPRPFRAHVTLARRAAGAVAPPAHPPIEWPADDGYVLVRSLPGGAGYQILERFSPP
jgi:RNA 2',3'-cyclic 3'-phosphodiesterase